LLAKPEIIKTDEQSQEGNDKETSKSEDEVALQIKTEAKKAYPCLEKD
jgi:hypothetical protein